MPVTSLQFRRPGMLRKAVFIMPGKAVSIMPRKAVSIMPQQCARQMTKPGSPLRARLKPALPGACDADEAGGGQLDDGERAADGPILGDPRGGDDGGSQPPRQQHAAGPAFALLAGCLRGHPGPPPLPLRLARRQQHHSAGMPTFLSICPPTHVHAPPVST